MIMSLMALLLQLHPQYFTSLWAGKRLTSFATIGIFGIIPSLHWTWLHGGFTQNIVQVTYVTTKAVTEKIPFYYVKCFMEISGSDESDNLTCKIIDGNFTCERLLLFNRSPSL